MKRLLLAALLVCSSNVQAEEWKVWGNCVAFQDQEDEKGTIVTLIMEVVPEEKEYRIAIQNDAWDIKDSIRENAFIHLDNFKSVAYGYAGGSHLMFDIPINQEFVAAMKRSKRLRFYSNDGKLLFDFQLEGVEKAMTSMAVCLNKNGSERKLQPNI